MTSKHRLRRGLVLFAALSLALAGLAIGSPSSAIADPEADEVQYYGFVSSEPVPDQMSRTEVEKLASPEVEPRTNVPAGYAIQGKNIRTSYIYQSDARIAGLAACTGSNCTTHTTLRFRVRENVTGGTSKHWDITTYSSVVNNPGGHGWTLHWQYWCGVNKKLERDPECANGAWPSGELLELSVGNPYGRRFETINSGRNYPMWAIIVRFDTGTQVVLKFRGWDVCNSTKSKLCSKGR